MGKLIGINVHLAEHCAVGGQFRKGKYGGGNANVGFGARFQTSKDPRAALTAEA